MTVVAMDLAARGVPFDDLADGLAKRSHVEQWSSSHDRDHSR